MPLRITRTRLMRQRAIATPPPICRSKGITAFFIQTCNCPDPGSCTSVDIQGLTFPEAQAMADGPDNTYGKWRYIDKEHHVDESGTWNHCHSDDKYDVTFNLYECDDRFRGQNNFLGITRDEALTFAAAIPHTKVEIFYFGSPPLPNDWVINCP